MIYSAQKNAAEAAAVQISPLDVSVKESKERIMAIFYRTLEETKQKMFQPTPVVIR